MFNFVSNMKTTPPIIVVDDDADDLDLITMTLEETHPHIEVKCFGNGAEALHYLSTTAEQTFLILSDINMPVLDGFALKKEINKNEALRKKSIPFIFLSTSDKHREVEKAYDVMAQGYFAKPAAYSELQNILHKMIDYWSTSLHPKTAKR